MGILYAKVAGSWVPIVNSSSAGMDQATADARYVNITGDAMTGTLVSAPPELTNHTTYRVGADDVARTWSRLTPAPPALIIQNAGVGKHIALWGTEAITFSVASIEAGRIDSAGNVMFYKTAAAVGNAGVHFVQANNQICGTVDADFQNLNMNKIGTAATAASGLFLRMTLNNSTIGTISRNASTSAVLYNTSSDYRLKNDRGLITNALERIKVLKPRRITWKSDPDETEQDGFFAHEVAEVVPEAVTGEKDAVATEADVEAERANEAGEIDPQQLDPSKLIPLLTAALQDALARIEVLEAAASG